MIRQEYERWRRLATDAAIADELVRIEADDKLIDDAFYRQLEFGTGGLRGVIGAGTNRMNIYTVMRATRGLADYLLETCKGNISVAIGYDTRINSRLFAETGAAVFASLGINVHMFSEPLPTPMLSYATRELGCAGGVMITASHNPSKYNGYKVYGSDGCQITENAAKAITEKINSIDYFDFDTMPNFNSYLGKEVRYIGEDMTEKFVKTVTRTSCLYGDTADKSISIVYTPLNGTGYVPVLKILKENGFENVSCVKEQAEPDGRFPTCPYPNPEIPEALTLGLEYAKAAHADILLATDPDCDRVGVCVCCGDEYKLLTGNEVGVLLLDYIATQRKIHNTLPGMPIAIKTIVTTDIAEAVAKKYGIEVCNVLTGFKYIGETVGNLEAVGEADRFVFGMEESCGYLGGSYVRDKDGVFASLLISEMAAYYKARGITLSDRLDEIYAEHGYTGNTLYSYAFEGADGFLKMQGIMSLVREEISSVGGMRVIRADDYKNGLNGLPPSDVIKLYLENGCSVVIRPSGTEPKLKIYISVTASDKKKAQELNSLIRASFEEIIK